MKTNNWEIVLLITLFGCTTNMMDNNGVLEESTFNLTIREGTCFPDVKDKYVYPVKPGMKEWQQFKSYDDAVKACQLPGKVLKSISTPGLIDALIHAPLFASSGTLANCRGRCGWMGVYGQFNSAKELFQRKNAGNALIEYYKLIRYDCIESLIGKEPNMLDEVYKTHIYWCIDGLEFLFTMQEIIDNMSHEMKKEVVTAFWNNYKQYPVNYWRIILMAYVMLADHFDPIEKYSQENAEFKRAVLNTSYPSEMQVVLIESFVKSYIIDKNN